MDVERSNQMPVAFRESSRAGLYTILIISSPLTIIIAAAAFLALNRTERLLLGTCLAAFGIRFLVRRINRRDDPRVKPPPLNPDGPRESN